MDTLEYLAEERKLVVQHIYTDYDKPIKTILSWPIATMSRSDAQIYALGSPLRQSGADPGRFCYDYKADVPEAARRIVFALAEGGKTQAIRVNQEPIPAPKIRKGIEVRWHAGRWEKYLKAGGWTPADTRPMTGNGHAS